MQIVFIKHVKREVKLSGILEFVAGFQQSQELADTRMYMGES